MNGDSPLHIRWLILRDMPAVLAIEQSSFVFPWDAQDFRRVLRTRNVIGNIVDDGERVLGFMIHEFHRNHLNLLNLAVAPDHRRRGIGRMMAGKLIGKLSSQRRNRITANIWEQNLDAQFFFHAMGFRAVGVLPAFFSDGRDAFQMQFRYLPSEQQRGFPVNRIQGLTKWSDQT